MCDIKPCPFCGGNVTHEMMADGSYSFTCIKCGLNARFPEDIASVRRDILDEAETKWNSRADCTCSMVLVEGPEESGICYRWKCSVCGGGVECGYKKESGARFCPDCGAKVVKHDQ